MKKKSPRFVGSFFENKKTYSLKENIERRGLMNRWKKWLFIIIVTAAAVCLLILAGLAFFNIFDGSKAVMPIHAPMP